MYTIQAAKKAHSHMLVGKCKKIIKKHMKTWSNIIFSTNQKYPNQFLNIVTTKITGCLKKNCKWYCRIA